MSNAFDQREPCRTDLLTVNGVQRDGVVRLSDWRANRGTPETRNARLDREAEARRRAEVLFERSQMPWWRRLLLGFRDLFH